jgi:VCBS repeat-containing protein
LTNLAVVSNDSDDDGDPLNIVAIGGQSVSPGGSVTLASGAIVTLNLDGTLDYDQNGAFDSLNVGESGQETFTYSVSDGLVSSNATVTVTVNGAFDNAAPDAQNDALSTDEDQATSGNVLSNDSDTDGDALTVTAVNGSGVNVGNQITLSSGALLTMNSDGSYDYDPNGAFDSLEDGQNGNDSFSYTIADGFGGSDTATVNVTINGVSPPTTTQPLLIDFEGETQGIYPGEGGLDFAGLNVVLTNGLSGAQAGSSGSDGDFTITASGEDFDLNSLSAIVRPGGQKCALTLMTTECLSALSRLTSARADLQMFLSTQRSIASIRSFSRLMASSSLMTSRLSLARPSTQEAKCTHEVAWQYASSLRLER